MRLVKAHNLFEELLKRKAKPQGRLLGLDVGDKYIGLAISDSTNRRASPLRYVICYLDGVVSIDVSKWMDM